MKIEDNRFIKILEWAYKKKKDGFSWEELTKEFNLTPDQNKWAQKVFLSDNLIDHFDYKDAYIYGITAKGISIIIEYRSGKRARCIAIAAIVIGVIFSVMLKYIK